MRISDWSSDVCSSDLVYLGWADGTRFEVHCCRYPTITEEEKITRIGIPPKQLHFGTSGTMLVQICHCRVDHGMLLACARHFPPSAKTAEIGVQPRCPIFGIVEESEIFAPGPLVDPGTCIYYPKPRLVPVRRVAPIAP